MRFLRKLVSTLSQYKFVVTPIARIKVTTFKTDHADWVQNLVTEFEILEGIYSDCIKCSAVRSCWEAAGGYWREKLFIQLQSAQFWWKNHEMWEEKGRLVLLFLWCSAQNEQHLMEILCK